MAVPEEERLRAAARSSEKAAFFVRNELLHAPCTARRTDARRSAATGSAARTARRSGILSRRTEEKIDPGSGAACVPAEIAKHRAPGRPLSGEEGCRSVSEGNGHWGILCALCSAWMPPHLSDEARPKG